ncbi:hypothetical protein EPO34_02320 [Patescibacteria group bacterium]|nr:MAG: hypothetical protein EPO34_02320 [Patescibacteria group bacterium]
MPAPRTLEQTSGNSWKIKRVKAISAVFPEIPEDCDIEEALAKIEAFVRKEASEIGVAINSNAFNNARGEWFEMLLAARFYNLSKKSGKFCLFTIPNVSAVEFTEFFDEDVRSRIRELKDHLSLQGIELQMSNPDFVCLDLRKIDRESAAAAFSQPAIKTFDETTAEFLDRLYQKFVGRCPFDGMKFVVSAKTSVRPDRRYQFVHEGNIIKALTAHLQTRYWKIDFSTKYYALTNTEPTGPDQAVLKTAAISSITNVFAESVRAVDGISCIRKLSDIDDFFDRSTRK